jgi:VanZ family protein
VSGGAIGRPPVKRILLWAPVVAYMGLIFIASSVPGNELPGRFWDKAVHFLVYAGLGVLFLVPLAEARFSLVGSRTAALAVLLATLHGAFDEIHQYFTPNRTPDVRDLFADALGATAGVLGVLLLRAAVKKLRLFEWHEGR